MKKISFIVIILFIPVLVQAQSMIEIKNDNINQDAGDYFLINKEPSVNKQETKETTTINVEINLPDIKILPSSPFYSLKKAWENVRGWFIFNTEKKTEYGISLANRRLEEIESLAQKKKTNLINKTTGEFNKQMDKVNKNIDKAKEKGKDLDNIYDILESNRQKHQAVFDKLMDQIPIEAKAAVKQAKDISQRGYEMAQEKIKPRAIKGGLEGIEKVKEGLDVLEKKLEEKTSE